jgi:hypothetical protein
MARFPRRTLLALSACLLLALAFAWNFDGVRAGGIYDRLGLVGFMARDVMGAMTPEGMR